MGVATLDQPALAKPPVRTDGEQHQPVSANLGPEQKTTIGGNHSGGPKLLNLGHGCPTHQDSTVPIHKVLQRLCHLFQLLCLLEVGVAGPIGFLQGKG